MVRTRQSPPFDFFHAPEVSMLWSILESSKQIIRSDGGMQVPITEDVGGEAIVCGPSIVAKNETDIFTTLGLHYVPPHLRHSMRDDL
jgi:hypothetical protein